MSDIRTCKHLRTSGALCQSPALRHNTLCYFHYRLAQREQRRIKLGGPCSPSGNTGIELPLLEDAESIQVAIMEVAKALIDQRIDEKRAGLLLYSFQLALQNLRNLHPPTEGERDLRRKEKQTSSHVLDARDSRWEGALEDPIDPESAPFDQAPDSTEIISGPAQSQGPNLREILRKFGFYDTDEATETAAPEAGKPPASVTQPEPHSTQSTA